jgi:ribose-phosphate pyrophosphokinase
MDLLLFANSGNPNLVNNLLEELSDIPTFSGCRRADMKLKFHADDEPYVEIVDNVRRGQGRKCIVVGCIARSDKRSVNDHAMEMFVLLDALKRADAEIEVLILPYLPYARQDRRRGETTDRTAITAELFARFLNQAASCRVCVVEPHTVYIEGFFDSPVDRIPVIHEFVPHIKQAFTETEKICVVSPDRGGWERASALANMLGTPHAIAWIDKRRTAPGEAKALQLVGEVKDLDAVLIDDMIDTAGSLCEAAETLHKEGARRILVCAVHGLFSGTALDKIGQSSVERIIVTSSVLQGQEVMKHPKIEVIPIGYLLAQAIHRLMAGESLRTLGKPRR